MSIGDRMKAYERMSGCEDVFMPTLPVIVRLDGKAFHSFTRGMERPYDRRLTAMMVGVTCALVDMTNACIGYTQSDEVTLILYSGNHKSEIFFGGRRDKLVSVLASAATLYFDRVLPEVIPEKSHLEAMFDARAFQVPSQIEAVNNLFWREQDATRNSILSAGQAHFSHKELHGKKCNEIQEMLHLIGVNWNDYPAFFKRGTYIQRTRILRPFTVDEIDRLPPKHAARKNPDLTVERSEIRQLDMPPIARVENKIEVVFGGAIPESSAKEKME